MLPLTFFFPPHFKFNSSQLKHHILYPTLKVHPEEGYQRLTLQRQLDCWHFSQNLIEPSWKKLPLDVFLAAQNITRPISILFREQDGRVQLWWKREAANRNCFTVTLWVHVTGPFQMWKIEGAFSYLTSCSEGAFPRLMLCAGFFTDGHAGHELA